MELTIDKMRLGMEIGKSNVMATSEILKYFHATSMQMLKTLVECLLKGGLQVKMYLQFKNQFTLIIS